MSEPVRILIVEDSRPDFDLAQREIRKAVDDCVFQQAQTREDFLNALETFQPDLILSDYHLPRFDGMTALKLAQEHAKLTPFIIWTGTLGEDIAVEFMRAGAVNYILKDNLKRLGTAVTHALEERRLLLEHKQAEETIHHNEKRFRALIENGQDNISLLALDGTLLWESPATRRSLGYAPDKFVGHNIFELMHPDDLKWTSELYAKLLQEPGGRQEGVFRLLHSDGSWRWNEATLTNMLNEPGVNAIVVNYRDITERKQAEDALRESQIKYENLVETTHDLIWSVDADGRITFLNRAAKEIYGYEPEELIGHSFFEILDPQYYDLDLKKPSETVAQSSDEVKELEVHVRHRDGRQIVLSSNSLVHHDADGKVVNITGSSHDITERKQAEELLENERNLLRTLIDNLPDRIFAMDTQGRKTLSNTADWMASGGETMGDVLGKTDFDTYPPELAQEFWAFEKAVLDSGEPIINYEEPGLDSEGNPVWVLSTKIPLRDSEGKVTGLVGIGRDITARKQSDMERQALLEIMQGLANTDDLQEFLKLIHQSIARVIYAENFFIVFYNKDSGLFEEIYSVDKYDEPAPPSALEKSITSYVFRSGEPLLLTQARFDELAEQGEVELVGTDSESWLGVPLKTQNGTIGVLAVQHYEDPNRYTERDKDFLALIGLQVALAIERKQAEEALNESEEKFRAVADYSIQGIALFQEGTITYVNPANCNITGFSFEESLALTVAQQLESIHPDDSARVLERLAGSARGDMIDEVNELRIIRKDGEVRWVLASSKLFILQGKPARLGMMVDITDRKQAEEALRQSENRYSLASKATNDVIWEWDQETNQLFWNENAQSVFGYPAEEIGSYETWWEDHIHVDDRERVLSKLSVLIAGDQAIWTDEYRFLRKDSSYAFIIDRAYVERHASGKPLRVIGAMTDITSRKEAEDALRDREQHLNAIIENEPECIKILASDGSILQMNPAGLAMIEAENIQAVLGKSIYPLVTAEYQQTFQDLIERVFMGESGKLEFEIVGLKGTHRWLDTHAVPMRNELGEVTGLLGITRDVTERKQAEDLLNYHARLLRYINDAVIATDDQLRITAWNRAAEKMYGWRSEEVMGRTISEILSFGLSDEQRQEARKLLTESMASRSEMIHQHRDGRTLYVESNTIALLNEHRRMTGYVSVNRDITERKQAEQKIQRRVGELEALYQSGLTFSQTFDQNEIAEKVIEVVRVHLNWHHAAVRLRREETDELELIAFSSSDDHDHDEDEVEAHIQSMVTHVGQGMAGWVIEHGKTLRVGNVNEDPRYVKTYPGMQSGLYVPLKIHEHTLGSISVESDQPNAFTQEDERLLTTLGVQATVAIENARLFQRAQQELFERKRAEEALHHREEQYRSLFEDSPISLWVEDFSAVKQRLDELKEREIVDLPTYFREHPNFVTELAGQVRILDVNNAAMKLYHAREKSELLGSLAEVFHILLPEQFETELIQIANGRLNFEREEEDQTLTGEKIHVNVRWSVAPGYEDSLAQVIVSTVDITERKRAEEKIQLQLQRVRALRAIDGAISSSFDLHLTLNLLLDQVIAQLNVDAAVILLFHPSTSTLEHTASRGLHSTAAREARLRVGEGYAGKAMLERRIIHIPNLMETDSELRQALLLKSESFMDYYGVPLIVKGEVKGVLETFHRSALADDPEWVDFLETLAGQAAIAIDNATLFEDLQHSNRELFQAYDATIEGWSHALDLRDKETEGHTLRVTEMTLELARKFGFTDEQLRYARWGALLHDIGKMGVPDHILLKPDKLTDEEWVRMREHPVFALEMLSPIAYLKSSLDIPYCHHEKWNGTGYPRGLKGEVIPLAARLFAIVDVWDALRSNRPYRKGWSVEKTLDHIQSLSGTHFDPQVVEHFLKMIDRPN
ncbi:MAG: PAS domain S-box protein [Anaerolineales bacterium]